MAGQIVVSANTLTSGIRSEFRGIYRATYSNVAARLAPVMELKVPSDSRTSLWAYYESSPQARLWRDGESIPTDEFGSVQFSTENRSWAVRVQWSQDDREDDQTYSLLERARDSGRSFAQLDERVFYQLLLNSSDNSLLPAIPLSADGVALYSTTDATGGARFGATNGNLLVGTGVATSAAVRTDAFSAMDQIRSFQDTAGAPLFDPGDLGSFHIFYGVHNDQVFREAFQQGRTLDGGAAVSNIILESGLKIVLNATQRIPSGDDDWFLFAEMPGRRKSIFQQERRAIRETMSTWQNSDLARETKIEGIQWDSRSGYGIAVPYNTVKINN